MTVISKETNKDTFTKKSLIEPPIIHYANADV